MAKARQVAGGGRAVEVPPERLAGWFARFADRHGGIVTTEGAPDAVRVTAADGATATATVPFGPFDGGTVEALVAHALVPRRIALVLVRLGGHSIGVARGGRVELSRTGRHLVQGRSAAGGWSQQRFARRRAGQARHALREAAQDVFEVLVPRLSEVDAVVLGGDRRALDELREDRRLAALFARAEPRVLEVGEPSRAVLEEAAVRALSVQVTLRDG
ncbi:acVLRF1 family peptidyl-tRNA hydrolase [Amycolatopsis mongoliensis]|uniref:AcVLRF1 family peptidyl-tRNA hydrolase n=1 Tax=Amycolatopsis mongoliensis TaxID=715475 RepID=A0A9Y2JG21_9PSEU|nr:acVLRF1 family peptidyl-tRNA hydrolase [Amycolatopsis sp. 4-36]WIX97955.1 acVLRF1 family peptidyl-tRNA hydrolase [Amycolatopsis sp. 4-36]